MSLIVLACLFIGHPTVKPELPKQSVCRADMDDEIEGYLWAMWPDWYFDECA